MQVEIRDYKNADYAQCEALVNQAWRFDSIFAPQALSDLAKHLYTQGSVQGSNYLRVAEVEGKVVGFIFGLNNRKPRPKRNLWYGVRMLWRFLRIRSEKPNGKRILSNAIVEHERNRSQVVNRGVSEIVLFVVDEEFKGKGIGRSLWEGFRHECEESGVGSLVVETNKLGASGFYESLGFRHVDDFHSPLHELATPGGQACMYEYLCQ